LVNVTKKPTFAVEDVGKTHIMPGSVSALPVDSEDQRGSAAINGRTRRSMATG
jgi:hypothetical protein